MGSSTGRVNSRNQRTWTSLSPRVKQLISLSCRYSNLRETTMLMLSWRQRRTVCRQKAVAWRLWLGGIPFSQKQWLDSPCKNWFHRLRSPSLGMNRRRKGVFLCGDFWGENWSAKKQKTHKNKSQIKHTGIRLGSRTPIGSEILHIDFLGKVIHGDEINVLFVTCETAFTCCFTSTTFCLAFFVKVCQWLWLKAQGRIAQRSVCVVCAKWRLDYHCFRSSYSLGIVSIGPGLLGSYTFFVILVVCFLVSSSRTSYTYRTLYIHSVNRDVLCQLPSEAGHPPEIAARLKKPACGISDVCRHWWNVLDRALCSCGVVPTRADRCGYVLYSNV